MTWRALSPTPCLGGGIHGEVGAVEAVDVVHEGAVEEGHSEPALEPRSDESAWLIFRVKAHTNARTQLVELTSVQCSFSKENLQGQTGQGRRVIENKHSTEIGACSYRRAESARGFNDELSDCSE